MLSYVLIAQSAVIKRVLSYLLIAQSAVVKRVLSYLLIAQSAVTDVNQDRPTAEGRFFLVTNV